MSSEDRFAVKLPSGLSLLMAGSGLYWILSSQLIASFTVITPGVFSSDPGAVLFVLLVGIMATTVGLWNINGDLEQIVNLLNRRDGYLYLMPLLLSSGDIAVTLVGLSGSNEIVELNPLVASVVQAGPMVFAAFTVSYLVLSAGLTLVMLHAGHVLFPSRPWRFLSFAFICGAASFGFLNNLIVLALPEFFGYSTLGALFGAFLLGSLVFELLAKEDKQYSSLTAQNSQLGLTSPSFTSN